MMLTPEVAVVARENKEGIVELPGFFERFQEASNAFIDRSQAA